MCITCNTYVLNSTLLFLINLRVTSFRVSFAVGYIIKTSVARLDGGNDVYIDLWEPLSTKAFASVCNT